MLLSNKMVAILNQAWLQSNVKKVSPKCYSACGGVTLNMQNNNMRRGNIKSPPVECVVNSGHKFSCYVNARLLC